MNNWKNYYSRHLTREPREEVRNALPFCTKKRWALDLGAGTLIESRFLIEYGFANVVAVDSCYEVKSFASNFDTKKFTLVLESFDSYQFPTNRFDFITAQFSLPFYGKKSFRQFFQAIVDSLTTGGVFTAQLFGELDDWNTEDSKLIFHTETQAKKLLSDLVILDFKIINKEGFTASGEFKHWHVFNFIAKKV